MGKPEHESAPPPTRSPSARPMPFPWETSPPQRPPSLAGPLTELHHDPQVLWQTQKLESLGLLAGGVAHDFNNHLLAIMGNADLMTQSLPSDTEQGHLLAEIQLAARRAGDLCNQLLAFAGEGQFRIQPLDLSATVTGMTDMLKVAVSRKIDLRLTMAPGLPPVAGDSARIRQVVMNLVVNAAEAIGDRPGTVTLKTGVCQAGDCQLTHWILTPGSGAHSFVYLTVSDTGPGMDRETVARAFDPFYSTKPHGRGLGLASVLGIMRSHRGGVGVDTIPGQGTTVTVLIPFRPVPDHREVPDRIPTRHRTGGTILVVDDEEYLRLLSKRMLRRLGYTVHVADGGPAALSMCSELGEDLDCVLLDLIMPGMDGAEVHAALLRRYPRLKVLLTSGYHEAEVSRRFAGRGLAGFLQKPYTLDDLAAKLDEVLNRPEAAPPAMD